MFKPIAIDPSRLNVALHLQPHALANRLQILRFALVEISMVGQLILQEPDLGRLEALDFLLLQSLDQELGTAPNFAREVVYRPDERLGDSS